MTSMRMTTRACAALLALLLANACAVRPTQIGVAPTAKVAEDLRELRRELMTAIDTGDRAALEELLAPGFVFIHSTGVLEMRQQYIDRMAASAAKGSGTPSNLVFSEEQIRLYGDTAIWTTRSVRPSDGKRPELSFRGTDVIVRVGSKWLWASVHSTLLPTPPNPGEAPHK
jgi:hypothetical protein